MLQSQAEIEGLRGVEWFKSLGQLELGTLGPWDCGTLRFIYSGVIHVKLRRSHSVEVEGGVGYGWLLVWK